MDDHMHGWAWSRPVDDKYCDALPMEHSTDGNEPYVDSLRQLNRIVERILPEKSPLSLMAIRPKLDIPASLKRVFVDHKDCSREFSARKPSSLSSSISEIPMDSPVKHVPLSTMPGVCLEDSLRLKALRPSDSLNDSAYETYCGDASNDAIDSIEKNARADEVSSGNDPSDFCFSPSGRKSEDDPKPLFYGKEKQDRTNGCSLTKEAGDDLGLCSKSAGDVEFERSRSKSLESAVLEQMDGDRSKCPNGSHHANVFGSDSSAAGLGRYIVDDKRRTSNNLSIHVTTSQHSAKIGSAPSSSNSLSEGSSLADSSYPLGRKTGNLREGSSAADEELKSFSCPHCAYSASKRGQVRKHLSVHGIFLCAHCEFACDRSDLLDEHRRIRHPGLCGRRLCKKCRVLFQSCDLEAHERQCSGVKQRWACHTCGKEFKFLSVMKAHAHKWHPLVDDGVSTKPADTASDTASSKPCSVSSGTPSLTLNTTPPDTVLDRDNKQFQCTECGKMFKTKWTLSNHTLSHAGADTPFCCDVDGCTGVTFRSDKELNCHRMAVHRLGPTKYECSHPGCTMQFAKYGHFKRHQLTHTASVESDSLSADGSERRFFCDWTQCGKSFSHPDNLRVHYRRHTDEKPHHCHHCEAAYRQKSGLKYHLEKVHGEKTTGRCGRKRKLESSGMLALTSVKQVPAGGAVESCRPPSLCTEVESRGGQTAGDIAVNVKHTALSKVQEINISVSDLQAKQWSKSDTSSSAKGRRWSLPESLSQDCDDNLENIDINDEWLLDENDGFISNHRNPVEAGNTRIAEEGDRDQAGSTSDTEPLDEDLCEELRKLSDAINSEVLSPRALENMSSPFDSPPIGTAYGAGKSDSIGNVLPDMSSSGPVLYRGVSNHQDQAGVFDHFSSTSPPRDSDITGEFYSRCTDGAVTSVSTSSMMAHGRYNSGSSDPTEIANGYLHEGYSCVDVPSAQFDRNTSASEPELIEQVPYHSTPYEGSIDPWSPRWSSHSSDNTAFIPGHSISSVTTCSSSEIGFGREDGTYSNLMSPWPAAENPGHWLGQDGIIPTGWSREQYLATVRTQPRRHDWHMGRQGESAFSRSGPAAFDSHIGFEAASPKPYRADVAEVPSLSSHLIESFTGKRSGLYPASGISRMGSWSDLYGQSSRVTGIGSYEYSFPRSVYRTPVQSDRFYLTSGYTSMQPCGSYEHAVETESSRDPYRIPPVPVPSWPMTGLSNAGESLRPMPDAQQSSMLYNVVPRYY